MDEKNKSRLGNIFISANDVDTTFLFATPSLLSGMARAIDIYGQFDSYDSSETTEIADAIALYSDFRLVGQDLREAIESVADDKNDPIDRRQLFFAFRDLKSSLNDARQHTGQQREIEF